MEVYRSEIPDYEDDLEIERKEHPFVTKCREFSLELFFYDKQCQEQGDESHKRWDCMHEMRMVGAKAAGALGTQSAGPSFVVAYLKRCHSYLQKSLNLFIEADQNGDFGDRSDEFYQKIFGLRDELLGLIKEFRAMIK